MMGIGVSVCRCFSLSSDKCKKKNYVQKMSSRSFDVIARVPQDDELMNDGDDCTRQPLNVLTIKVNTFRNVNRKPPNQKTTDVSTRRNTNSTVVECRWNPY